MQKVGKFGIGDALQIGGAVMSMGAGSIPGAAAGAAATAAPMVINPYGNMAPASGQVYRSLGPAAPGQY